MKTAIIYTGAFRSFDRCWPTHKWAFWRHFGELSFFVSTYKDGTEGQSSILKEQFPNSQVEIEIVEKQPVFTFGKPWIPGQPFTHEPYAISVSPQAVKAQLWQMERGWELLQRTAGNISFDLVIRCRPDLWFHSLSTPAIPHPNECLSPWWGRFGGINDRFAIMDAECAPSYFLTFNHLKELQANGCPFHPESLVKASLARHKAIITDSLKAEFSTLRANGELRPPEISSIDLAHAALSR